MDRDEQWVLRQVDERDDFISNLLDDDRAFDEFDDPFAIRADLMEDAWRFFAGEFFRKAGPWTVRAAQSAPIKIRHNKPAICRRQLHACPGRRKLESERLKTAQLMRRCYRAAQSDQRDQLDDYYAEQFTDIPSVGLSTTNAHFRDNVGEYVLMYESYADDDAEDVDLDVEPPAWFLHGFSSEEEYLRYFDDVAWFNELSSYNYDELETA